MCSLEEKKKEGASVIRERRGEEVGYESAPRSAVRSADAEPIRGGQRQIEQSFCFMFHRQRAKNLIRNDPWPPESSRARGGRNTHTKEAFVCGAVQHADSRHTLVIPDHDQHDPEPDKMLWWEESVRDRTTRFAQSAGGASQRSPPELTEDRRRTLIGNKCGG